MDSFALTYGRNVTLSAGGGRHGSEGSEYRAGDGGGEGALEDKPSGPHHFSTILQLWNALQRHYTGSVQEDQLVRALPYTEVMTPFKKKHMKERRRRQAQVLNDRKVLDDKIKRYRDWKKTISGSHQTPDIDTIVERYMDWKGRNPLPPNKATGKRRRGKGAANTQENKEAADDEGGNDPVHDPTPEPEPVPVLVPDDGPQTSSAASMSLVAPEQRGDPPRDADCRHGTATRCQYLHVLTWQRHHLAAWQAFCGKMLQGGRDLCIVAACMRDPAMPLSFVLQTIYKVWPPDGEGSLGDIFLPLGCHRDGHGGNIGFLEAMMVASEQQYASLAAGETSLVRVCGYSLCMNPHHHYFRRPGETSESRHGCHNAWEAKRLANPELPVPEHCQAHQPPCLLRMGQDDMYSNVLREFSILNHVRIGPMVPFRRLGVLGEMTSSGDDIVPITNHQLGKWFPKTAPGLDIDEAAFPPPVMKRKGNGHVSPDGQLYLSRWTKEGVAQIVKMDAYINPKVTFSIRDAKLKLEDNPPARRLSTGSLRERFLDSLTMFHSGEVLQPVLPGAPDSAHE
ncbi:hypothetical protein GGR56DRAFT_675851 [Xylariaceae sp. FL0804]|nr:hypothetical protein GGR56DRAFT_675851 [Xylariaceae sp. FL0804]